MSSLFISVSEPIKLNILYDFSTSSGKS